MIENIVVTKFGSEADDANKTTFTSTTAWSDNSSDLIVYRNGVLQTRPSDYSAIDTYTIKFKYEIADTEQIQFVITRLSNNEFNRERIIDIDRAVKKLENKTQTSTEKRVFEEVVPSTMYVHANEVWSDEIHSDPNFSVAEGTALKLTLTLHEDITVANKLGWYASHDGLLTNTVKKWINPRFGKQYTVKLYDANDVEIESSNPIGWHWDYSSGYLFIANKNTRATPFKIVGYVYNGRVGVGSGEGEGGSGTWAEPVLNKTLLPTINNLDGEVRLVIDESQLYRWTSTEWVRIYTLSQKFKDPVDTLASLPTTGNENGDFRLVLNENSIYRWNSSTLEWLDVINKHYHDDRYYKKYEVDDLLEKLKQIDKSHTHDTLYYRKEEVTQMVRWRPSVSNESQLPPYTENLDGDVILTRDTNTIWRYDYFANPARWIPITSAMSTWKSPVSTKSLLPLYENRVGDTRLVIDEDAFYFWDGFEWTGVKILEHDHDNRYYTKQYIDSLNFNWKAPVATENSLPTNGNFTGDVRMTADTLSAFFWDGSKWIKWTSSPRWREPVATLLQLPTFNNIEGDIRYVKSEKFLYVWNSTTSRWDSLKLPDHQHNDLYYTKTEIDSGLFDYRYYKKNEIDQKFDPNLGHDHDGVDSRRVDYNNLLNIPYFYWKNPVLRESDLPISGNEIGDSRIIIETSSCFTWTGSEWKLINEGNFAVKNHEHDSRYYLKEEISDLIDQINNEFNSALMTKAERTHDHDERYYLKEVVDNLIQDRFDIEDGHAHTGRDSKRINYYDLLNIPATYMTHDHDDRYYTKINLETSGQSVINWDNIINKPDLGNSHWKSPVQTVLDLPKVNNQVGDIRLVLNDSDIYEWVGTQWILIGRWDNKYITYWREPVSSYFDLPLINNVDGDVRLVLSENVFYRWNQNMQVWVTILQVESDAQVYLNGNQLFGQGIDWARIKEREVQLKIPAQAGDKVTLLLKYDYKTLRKDFVSYSGQKTFNFSTGYFREDYIANEGQTKFVRQHSYINGGNAILIWLNGLLQRTGIDYVELDSYSFEFTNQLTANDRVITISLEHANGDGEYIREDYEAEEGQRDFILLNSYTLGGANLVVYLNGLLQRSNVDYKEINNGKISFYNSCAAQDKVTFVIFNLDAVKGCCDADQIALGNPKDGSWAPGLFDFHSAYKVAYALDDINEILLEVAPQKPKTLQSLEFEIENIELYSGYESIGNDFYEGVPGIYRNYLTESSSFYLYTPSGDAFGDADKGVLSLFVNNLKIDEFNLYNAFVEDNKKEKQSGINYGVQANGARFDEGLPGNNGALRNSTNNFLSIMSVEPYNNFSVYQKGRVRINVVSSILRKGYNVIYLSHQTDTNLYTSLSFKFFWDNSNSRPEIVESINLEQSEVTSNKFVSGIRYYSVGDKFVADFNVSRAFNNVFSLVPMKYSMPGLNETEIEYNDENISGVSEKPVIGELIDYNGEFRLNKYNEYSIDARLNVTTLDPFGEGQSKESDPKNMLVNTFTNGSTDKIEFFRDEVYRLPSNDYDTVPVARKNVWNSRDSLIEGQCMLFNRRLMYANTNFIGYKPDQIVDYSAFSQEQYYYRSLYDNNPKNNGTFMITGISEDNLIKNKLWIDIKLPGVTGWLSLNKYYDVSEFTGADGNGCLLRVEDNKFYFSFGSFSTANSGFMMIFRVKMINTSPNIEYLELM